MEFNPKEMLQALPQQEDKERIPSEESQEAARALYLQRLRGGRVNDFIQVALSDPETRSKFYDTFNDREVIFAGEQSGGNREATGVAVSMMRDPDLREMFLAMIVEDMRERSEYLKQAIQDVRPKLDRGEFASEEVQEASVYNRLVVGAGVHAAIFNTAFTATRAGTKTLTVDSGNLISANFSTKSFVSINSPNKPHSAEIPNFGLQKGNQNYFGKNAPVQMPYIEPEVFPTANVIAEVATVNQFLSNSDTLFDTKVERVILAKEDPKSSQWPAQNKVVFSDGTYVFADEVIITTGLGEEILPSQFDDQSRAIVRRDFESLEEGVPPGVLTYETFGKFVNESQTPLRHFAGKTVDLAGGGDGAATAAEQLLRLAKRGSYKLDVAQTGTPDKVHWVGQRISTSSQYKSLLKNNRYLMLASEMPLSEEELAAFSEVDRERIQKALEPVNGHLVQIRDSDNPEYRYRVTYIMEDKTVREAYTDFVILATGYKNGLNKLFGADENPFNDPAKAEAVKGFFEDQQATIPVGVKLKDGSVYAAGPASHGQVLLDAERELFNDPLRKSSAVAIAVHGPRTEKLAQQLAKTPDKHVLPKFSVGFPSIELEVVSDQAGSPRILKADQSPSVETSELNEVSLKTHFANVFRKCNIVAKDLEKIQIFATRNKEQLNSATVCFSPKLTNEDELVAALESEGVVSLILALVGKGRWDIVIEVPFRSSGDVLVPEINIRRETNAMKKLLAGSASEELVN